ncbi:MAG: C25 family cysteine peptidase [Candidatus Eisenbacteria bacterium]
MTAAAIFALVALPEVLPAYEGAGAADPAPPALESSVRVVEQAGDRLVVRFTAESSGRWNLASPDGPEPLELAAYGSAGSGRTGGLTDIWRASSRAPASFSVMLQVPDRGPVEFDVVASNLSGGLAEGSIEMSEPSVIRDIRVVTVTFTPPLDGPGQACSLDLAITAGAGRGANEKTRHLPYLSPAFRRLYESTTLNYRPDAEGPPTVSFRDPAPDGARYLIITANAYESEIMPLAEWKHAKGLLTKVVNLSTVGSTTTDIKNYIQNAYDTWTVPPEFVLLVGDTEQLPTNMVQHPILEVYTDNPYSMLEGSDVFSDVFIGRISADSDSHVNTQVAKILGYERTPVTGDPDWPLSASLLIADDHDSGDWVYYDNTWHIYDLMESASFATIDTLFHKNDVTRTQVYNSVNNGAGFINFRGQAWYDWPYPFDLDTGSVTTGWRLPVVVSATCYTGYYANDSFMCEDWVRAGTPTSPKGGVAFFATGTAYPGELELALRRGYVDEGFFSNVFSQSGLTLGEACVAGKNNMYKLTTEEEEYDGWNLLGDPGMDLWSGPMRTLTVSHDQAVPPGHSDFAVTVTNGRAYVEGALVACVKGDETYSWGYTDALGEVTLSVDPTTQGTGTVTATAKNAVPYEGTLEVVTGPYPTLEALTLDDSTGGNGDGHLSPGETAILGTALTNIGDATATAVQATWRTQDPYVTVLDSTSSYADIPPDSVRWASGSFEISLSPTCPSGHRLHYTLHVSYNGTDNTLAPPPMTVETGHLTDSSVVVDDAAPGGDGSGTLSPGETVGLWVSLSNDGPCDLAGVSAVLTTADPNVVVTSSSASFGDAPSGGAADNAASPYVLTVSPSASGGHVVTLSLDVTADGGHYTYSDTLELAFELTGGATMLPTGPDAYGYYVYDQTDGLFGPAPTYDWVDISPPGPGTLIAEVTDADAGVTTFSILWNFQYYGDTYNQLSVNSNGFFALGWTDYRLGDNSAIPSAHGPQNMLAPFWDDLDPSAGGDVYKWFDSVDHRWVFQFDNVRHWGMPFEETFQVILLHPTYYPTASGDGQIIIQYEEVSLVDGCTIGFENITQDDGIQCLYDGAYDPQIAPIGPGSALLITTTPPTGGGLPWLVLGDVTVDDSTYGNGNGRAEPGETVALSLELTNQGGLAVEGVSLTLSSPDGLAAISDSTGTMADLPPSGTADNAGDPFVLTVSEAVSDTVATLWTTIDANGGDYDGAQRIELHIDLTGTSVTEGGLPSVFRFHPCHPNPFTSGTAMRLALPERAHASVRIYNVSGRLVRTLIDEPLEGGERKLEWDGRNDEGLRCASGVYLVRVEAGGSAATRKAVLLR